MSLPLEGVRVLDLTRLLPGNYATLLLAGLGADVIKIEDPGSGDGTRFAPPYTASGESGPHAVLNRGKRSVAVDLKQAAGRELLLELLTNADVLIDAFRPGVLDRLGLTSAVLNAANDRLVHVTIDAFGSGGPYEYLPAHDLNAAGYGGVIGLARGTDGRPAMPSVPVVDHLSGLHAVVAVMAGLRQTSVAGSTGFRAEVAMSDSAASLLTLLGGYFAATREVPAAPEFLSGQLASYDLYECADGQWITVAGLEPKFFRRMLELMELPELAPLQFGPDTQDELRQALASKFMTRDRAQWLLLLAGEDTCVGPVNDVRAALNDPNLLARGMVTDIEFRDGTRAPVVRAVPWLDLGAVARPDASTLRQAPGLGDQTTEVLTWLGVTESRIGELKDAGVLGGS